MVDENANDDQSLWIFAYGSLIWRPNFEYEEKRTGFINGWIRKFYQGNIVHRGSSQKPGRVATLVESVKGETWGCAYRINRSKLQTLDYLRNRESSEGGYECVFTVFYPEIGSRSNSSKGRGKQYKEDVEEVIEGVVEEEEEEDDDEEEVEEEEENDLEEPIPCIVYIAFESNSYWLGKETEANIAKQVKGTGGKCGSNEEYVMSLYKYMKTTFPWIYDDHLEKIVKHL